MKASRLLIAGSIAALLPLAGAVAQTATPEQPTHPAQAGTTFESLDADSDGKISKAEAAVNPDVTRQFSKYDQNGDGFIEKDEVTAANTAGPAPAEPKQ